MKTLTLTAVAAILLGTVACDTLPKPGTRSYLSVATQETRNGPVKTIGTLFVWSNDVNAGVIYQNGRICMQRAMTSRATSGRLDGNAEGSAPVSVLSSMTAAAAEAGDGGNAEAAASLSAAIAQTATALSATSERTAFLDIGMFYICQLSANERISEAETQQLSRQLVLSAAGMTPAGVVPVVPAPDLPERDGE